MIWAAIVICLLVSFTFSGIEAGILSVSRVRLRHRAKKREPAALSLQRLLAHPERVLGTVLIVTNLMNITAIILSTQAIVEWIGWWGYVVAGIVWLPLYLLALEMLPKSLFRRFPYRALAALAGLLRMTDLLLSPLLNAGGWLIKVTFPKAPPGERKLFVAREEFKYLTVESELQGTLTKTEREMIHSVVDFRNVTARDVMKPVQPGDSVSLNTPIGEFMEKARQTRLDRMPVTGPDGGIAGLINVMDVLFERERTGTVAAFQRRPVAVKADEQAYSVMRKLRASRVRLAAVVDGSGQTVGMINWEDLIDKLVKTAVQA